MDQRQNNQFLDFSHNIENELQKGSIELLNQIKSCNTLDKKISNIHKSVNLRNGKEYQLIINGILNGMLFDVNMSLDNYFSILYSINQDSFKVFLRTLEKVLDFSKISKDKYDKIYQIFEKLANNNIDNNELTQILILICRNFYPGIIIIIKILIQIMKEIILIIIFINFCYLLNLIWILFLKTIKSLIYLVLFL